MAPSSNPASKLARTAASLGGLDSTSARPVRTVDELSLFRAIHELEARLREVGDVQRAARLVARSAADLLGADGVCIALLRPGDDDATFLQCGLDEKAGAKWDRRLLADFARGRKIEPPSGMALARLKRRARPWGTLAVRWNRSEPDWDGRNAITKLANAGNLALEAIERQRLVEVRARIDRKIMEQLRAKDLFYQILDGLRSLTGYDHTGMLLRVSADGAADMLEVAAEQMAWRKGKGKRIGAAVALPGAVRGALSDGRAWGFSRGAGAGEGWTPWDASTPPALVEWAGRGIPSGGLDQPEEAEVILAPLIGSAGFAAVMRVSALHASTFGLYECELLASFLPQAMVALHNAERTETLHDRVLQAERKHAMAELARGVSHDVNNALGSMLPLIQQLREEAAEGRVDAQTLSEDLAQIESSVQVCTRIFGGMLKFARHASIPSAAVKARVETAIDSVLALLTDGMTRRGVGVVHEVCAEGCEVPIRQSELEQVLLNLVGNARDAIVAAREADPESCREGRVILRAANVRATESSPAAVRIEVEDNGIGIEPGAAALSFEPFYTTKQSGTGLGLSVCRSIVWQAQGRIEIESPAQSPGGARGGPGCRVIVTMPAIGCEA